jgi:hypothetical protein
MNIESINELFRPLDNARTDINKGGCGIFAEHCYRWLKRNGFSDVKIMVIRPSIYNHVYCLVDGEWAVDCKGVINNNAMLIDRYSCPTNKVEEVCLDILSERNGQPHQWNNQFDRSFIPDHRRIFQHNTL